MPSIKRLGVRLFRRGSRPGGFGNPVEPRLLRGEASADLEVGVDPSIEASEEVFEDQPIIAVEHGRVALLESLLRGDRQGNARRSPCLGECGGGNALIVPEPAGIDRESSIEPSKRQAEVELTQRIINDAESLESAEHSFGSLPFEVDRPQHPLPGQEALDMYRGVPSQTRDLHEGQAGRFGKLPDRRSNPGTGSISGSATWRRDHRSLREEGRQGVML